MLGLLVGCHVYSASQPGKRGAERLPDHVALSIYAQGDADPTEAVSVRIFDGRLINDTLLHQVQRVNNPSHSSSTSDVHDNRVPPPEPFELSGSFKASVSVLFL